MKITLSIRNATLLFVLLILSSIINAQTISVTSTQTNNQSSATPIEVFSFETVGLRTPQQGAYYTHFWWFGDNGFSFLDRPEHIYQKWSTPRIVNTFAITTENYGTGGPPPLIKNPLPNPTSGIAHQPGILALGESIHVQHYRNAVLNDTMYLIVTYALPDNVQTGSGHLELQLDSDMTLLSTFITSNSEFTPNREVHTPNNGWTFTNLRPEEERSILVPVFIKRKAEETVSFRVDMKFDSLELAPTAGVTFCEKTIPVAKSHDPNHMIENSNAKNKCDFGGEQIDYRVGFQNTGDTTTEYISVTSYLDEKIDINSIFNVTLQSPLGPITVTQSALNNGYNSVQGAIYDINETDRTITFEFNNLVLRSTTDETCKNLSLTRAEVQFSVLVKPNFTFGDPIVAHSSIVFDTNEAMPTNEVITTCNDPLPINEGGGFNNPEPVNVVKCYSWIYITIALGILLLFILLRKFFKRK